MSFTNQVVGQSYVGDGSTTTFAIPFFFTPGTITTVLTVSNVNSTTGVKTAISSALYTLSPDNINPTNIVFLAAPAAAQKFYVERTTPIQQGASYGTTGAFPGKTAETIADRIAMEIQENRAIANQGVKVNFLDRNTVFTELPPATGNMHRLIYLNTAENGFEYGPTVESIAANVAAAAASATAAANSATGAAGSATSAASSATSANSSATAAAGSATAASGSASTASTQAAAALASQVAAATSATNAAASQTAAATSETNAATSATASAASAASYIDMRQGSGVPSNALGQDGDGYFDYTNKFVYQKVAGAYVLRSDLSTATGTGGALVRFGTGVPSNALGLDNDTYVDTVTGIFYLKASGAYASQYTDKHEVVSVAGRTGAVTLTSTDVGLANVDNTSDANKPLSTADVAALALKAPLASPTLTGTPVAPTAAALTNTTQIATTAYADAAVSTLSGTTTAALALKAPLASPALTGVPTAPTAAANTNTTQVATTAYVDTGLALKSNLASPTFTGVPAAPTAAVGTNTTQLATTAFALAAVGEKRASGVFTGTSVTPTARCVDQTFLYTGGSAQTFSTTGFGTISSLINGYRATIMGSSDTNTITIADSDIADGRLMNGDIELGKGQSITFEYNSTLARMVELSRSF